MNRQSVWLIVMNYSTIKDSAYFYLKTYTHLKEEVVGEERQRELFRKESQYEYDKQLEKQKLIKEAREAIVAEKEKTPDFDYRWSCLSFY